MKDSKDFDVNQFVSDGLASESTTATGDTKHSKRSVLTATTEPSVPTGQNGAVGKTESTSSSEQAVKTGQTASTLLSEQSKPPRQVEQPQHTASTQSSEPMLSTQSTRMTAKHRRASLDEYRETFMTVPKIIDRQPVFVSRETRDRIDNVVRRLGERKMSVSGFLENLARHHLNMYTDDLEQWKRL